MQIDSGSLDKIDQHTTNSLRCLNELWQYADALPTWLKQQLKEALAEHYHTLQQLEGALEELRWQNAELAATRQIVEAQLQKSLDLEAMLKRISDDVRDTLDESQILQTAVWELAVVLNLDGCDLGLYNADHTTSTIRYEYTLGVAPAQGQVVQMAEFIEGYRQLLQGQYFQFCELVPNLRSSAAILACPIFDDRGVLGDLWLSKRRDQAFNEIEIRLVQQVANQCALAQAGACPPSPFAKLGCITQHKRKFSH